MKALPAGSGQYIEDGRVENRMATVSLVNKLLSTEYGDGFNTAASQHSRVDGE
jgi:chorismate synthase